MLIELSCLHTLDHGIERRDELVLARHYYRSLALLELDRLRPIANNQPDCSESILAPPRTYPLLQLNELLAARVVANPLRDCDDVIAVSG